MSLQSVLPIVFDFHSEKPIVIEVSKSPLSSDAGLLPIRQLDEQVGFTRSIADAIQDLRSPGSIVQDCLSMVRQRIYGILAGYEDQNDHDVLRSDPVFKLIADRLPEDGDLASQPTLSRFENSVRIADLWRLRDELIDHFIATHPIRPTRITLDFDAVDDPTHGLQQLTLFHGFYEQYQYLPIVVTCAESEQVLLVGLRHGTSHAALGADDDLRYLTQRFRAVWPDVEICIRGDCGFGGPMMYDVSEELNVTYTFGIAMNPVLKKLSDGLLNEALIAYEKTQQPQRLFTGLWYQAGSWLQPRWVVIKAEANAQGTNQRAIVTNRLGAQVMPGAAYDAYAERGEAENRNKEFKIGLKGDRLSDHRFMANFFRLYLHAAALNLLVLARHTITPQPFTPQQLGLPQISPLTTPQSELPQVSPMPAEALPEPTRAKYFNRRREHDPLGGGQPCTWRTRLIKVAAEIIVSARRIVIRLSRSWPHLDLFADFGHAVLKASPDTT